MHKLVIPRRYLAKVQKRVGPNEGRPQTRGECVDGPRPCPWVSCKYHLSLDITWAGSIKVNGDAESMTETCALDVADRGGTTLEEIGQVMGLTRERIRQIEHQALGRMAKNRFLSLDFGDDEDLVQVRRPTSSSPGAATRTGHPEG